MVAQPLPPLLISTHYKCFEFQKINTKKFAHKQTIACDDFGAKIRKAQFTCQ